MILSAKASNSMNTSTAASEHRKVREIVRDLEKKGYSVQAEVRGRERPSPIGSTPWRPDIVATKDGQTLIVEVKTASSLPRAKQQQQAYARLAAQKADTTFRLVVTRPRKKRLVA